MCNVSRYITLKYNNSSLWEIYYFNEILTEFIFLVQKKFGARIIIEGEHILEAKEYAETLVENEGLTYINGYDDPSIVAGAGTMGIEMIDEVPCIDAVVVPIGGAGLIAGVSCAIKTLKPDTMVRFQL